MVMRYRLSSDCQADLSWYWTEADADLGVCSGGDIQHRGPPKAPQKPEPEPTGTLAERRKRRHERQNEEIRLMWHTLVTKNSVHANSIEDPVCCVMQSNGVPFEMDRTPMPAWARRVISKDRTRLLRIHGSVTRLVRGPSGPQHERVLYRVYGPVQRHPICYGRVGSELANIVEYTSLVADRMRHGMPAAEAGEAVLGKGTSYDNERAVRAEAEAMLVAASKAYATCDEAERQERRETRRARFRALLGAA